MCTDDFELCLTVASTDPDDPFHTALRFSAVEHALSGRNSPARVRVLILDCCFAGRAVSTNDRLSAVDGVVDHLAIDGVHTVAATTGNEPAFRPPVAQRATRPTLFTEALLDLVRAGLPTEQPYLTLAELYPHVRKRMSDRGLPTPRQKVVDLAGRLAFTRNSAYLGDGVSVMFRQPDLKGSPVPPPVAELPSGSTRTAPVADSADTSESSRSASVPLRTRSRGWHRIAALALVLVLAAVTVVLVVKTWPTSQRGDTGSSGTPSPGQPCKVIVASDILNIRSAPDGRAQIVGKVNRNAELPAEKVVENGFRKLGEGRWASGDFVRPVDGTDC